MKYCVGFDIGASKIRGAILSEYGNVIKVIKKPTGVVKSNEDLVDKVVAIYDELNVKEYSPFAIGIGICGPVEPHSGHVYVLPNLGLKDIPLKKLIEDKINVPTFINNDANLAGLAEAKLGAGVNRKIVQFLTISTGVGGGLIISGKIIEGHSGYAQEVGHMIIKHNSNEKINEHTNLGSFETCCSGTAIASIAKNAGMNVERAEDVFALAKKDDIRASNVIDIWIDDLALALSNINLLVEPDIFVFGGGVSNSITPYFSRIKERMKKYAMTGYHNDPELVKANLGNDAGLIGAALYAFYQAQK